jgi:hypothetical protein
MRESLRSNKLSSGDHLARATPVVAILAALAAIIFIITVLLEPPASEYEVSIYWQYPAVTWIALTVAVTGGISTVLLDVVSDTARRYWQYGGALLALTFLVVMFLPTFRGYFLYSRFNSDILVHLQMTRQIVQTGHLFTEDWYPILHVHFYILEALGLRRSAMTSVISFLFFLLYVVSMLVLGRTYGGRTDGIVFAAIGFVPFLMGFYRTLHPFLLSFMAVPLVLAAYRRYRTTVGPQWGLVVLVLVCSIAFFHPLSTLLLVGAMAVPVLTDLALMRKAAYLPARHAFFVLFPFVAVVAWISTFERLTTAISTLIAFYLTNRGTTIVQTQTSALGNELTPWQTAVRFMELYGPIVLLSLGAAFCLLVVLYRFVSDRSSRNELIAANHFLLGTVFAVVMMSGFFFAKNPVRVSRYMVLGESILLGTILADIAKPHRVAQRDRASSLLAIFLVALLLISVPIALQGLYKPNHHLPESEVEGTEWALRNHEDGTRVMAYRTDSKLVWFADRESAARGSAGPFVSADPPDRFGYEANTTLAETMSGDSQYLVTKQRDLEFHRIYYRSQRGTVREYRHRDVRKLNRDRTVGGVYANGGYRAWTV